MRKQLLDIGFIVLSILPLLGFATQENKTNAVLILSIALCLRAFYIGSLKIRHKTLLVSLFMLIFSVWFGFSVDLKPYIQIIVIFLLYASIPSKTANDVLPTALNCMLGLSIYGIVQYFGFDSLYTLNTSNPHAIFTPSYAVGATLGNPTYLGALLAMFVPLAIRERKWWHVGFMVTTVLLTKSDMAIGAMIASLLCIPFFVTFKRFILGCLVFLCFIGLIAFKQPKVQDNGRFETWKQSIEMMRENKKGLIGFGGGSFRALFGRTSSFKRAHNEYLQIMFEFGLIVLVPFMMFLGTELLFGKDVYSRSSVMCMCLLACGCFIWQLGYLQLASVLILRINEDT